MISWSQLSGLSCKASLCWLYEDEFSSARDGKCFRGCAIDETTNDGGWTRRAWNTTHVGSRQLCTSKFTLGPLSFDWLFRIGLHSRRFLESRREIAIDRQLAISLMNRRVTRRGNPQRAQSNSSHGLSFSRILFRVQRNDIALQKLYKKAKI